MNRIITQKATREDRLDKIVSEILECARNQAEQMISANLIKVDDKPASKCGLKVKADQTITVTMPEAQKQEEKKCDFEIEILYEDDDILVLNKPPHLVVHPAPGTKDATLVDWLKAKSFSLSSLSGQERCGIVHRLDKETSGVMVVAKNNYAHSRLSSDLQKREIGRYYLAIIDLPLKDSAIVEKPLARNPNNRLKIGVVASGRHAKSAFLKIATDKNQKLELISAKLYTGRTHQIRAHLESISRHILGDGLYGFKSVSLKIPRVFLHAYVLYLTHPKSGKSMRFVANLPNDMKEFIDEHFEQELFEKIDPDNLSELFSSTF